MYARHERSPKGQGIHRFVEWFLLRVYLLMTSVYCAKEAVQEAQNKLASSGRKIGKTEGRNMLPGRDEWT
jgi:hypothetical protein